MCKITRALVDFVSPKKSSVALCFATQILLMDIRHGLRHSKIKAYNDLRMSGLRISKTIAE